MLKIKARPKVAYSSYEKGYSPLKPILREALAIFLLALALFAFVCRVMPEQTGWMGQVVMVFLGQKLFGVGAYVLPLFIAYAAWVLLAYREYSGFSVRLPGVAMTFLSVLTLASIKANPDFSYFIWPLPTQGGGYLGYLLAFAFVKVVGRVGSYVLLGSVLFLSSLLMANTTLANLGRHLHEWFQTQQERGAKGEEREAVSLPLVSVAGGASIWFKQSFMALRKVFGPLQDASILAQGEGLQIRQWDALKDHPVGLEDNPDVQVIRHDGRRKRTAQENFLVAGDDEDKRPETVSGKVARAYRSSPENPFIVEARDTLRSQSETERQKPRNKDYRLPGLNLLERPVRMHKSSRDLIEQQRLKLEDTLRNFSVDARVVSISCGPSVTRYEVEPGPGVRVAKISALSNDIALSLAAQGVRIEAPVPGKSVVGIEIPNPERQVVNLSAIIQSTDFYTRPSPLTACLGMGISGDPVLINLATMPHLLIAGATGSGKSVCVNAIICSILMRSRPDEVRFLMIDPKMVELSIYNDIPHLLAPVVTDPKKAAATLKSWAIKEMERRYEEFSAVGVKNIEGYNNRIEDIQRDDGLRARLGQIRLKDNFADPTGENYSAQLQSFVPEKIPYIVVVIDELADLMMVASNEVETTICRLAQLARATGIHLIVATQRPSVDVITGLIKANVPSRISFAVSSQIDSRTIIDTPGAEKLLGRGDMLYAPIDQMKPTRIQGVFIQEREIEGIIAHVKKQADPEYLDAILAVEPLADKGRRTGGDEEGDGLDPLFEEARALVAVTKHASTSYLQRKFRIGYNRAARIMDQLEAEGVVSTYDGENKARRVV